MRKKSKSTTLAIMENKFNSYLIASSLFSIIIILIGIILYTVPSIAIKTVSWIIGLLFISTGVFSVFSYLKKDAITLLGFNLIYGIISITLGLLIITNPFAIANILTIGLGIWLIISGSLKINYALRLKYIKELSWLLTLVVGFMSIIFGLMVMLNPFAKLLIVEVIGLFLIVYGVIDFTDTLLLKKRAKVFIKVFK